MEEQVISIQELLEALKKRWKLILAITVAATLISAIISFFVIKPQYEASTKVFIGKEQASTEGYNQGDIQMYQKLMKTYAETIKTKDLVGRAIKDIHINLTEGQVLNGLTVVPVADTQILQIKFKGRNPEETAKIVNAVSDEFIKTSKELVPNGNVQVIEAVQTPQNPVSPNKTMNIAIAFLLGLMVSVGLCFLLEFLDNTFKTKEQLEKELDLPVLGVIGTMEDGE